MVGVVVGGRARVGVRAVVLVVPRPDQEHVAHDDPAARRCPSSSRARSCPAGSGARPAPRRPPARAGSRRRRGPASRRTRSASRTAAGTATRRSRSAPRARTSRSRRGRRSRRSAGTGCAVTPRSGAHSLTGAPPRRGPAAPARRLPRASPARSGRAGRRTRAATASALSSPANRKTICVLAFTTGSVSVMRDTSGAMPGVSTPTTRRSRSPSASSPGNSEQDVRVRPDAEQHEVERARRPNSSSSFS